MGNESSQIAGASQDADGIIIKPDPESRETEDISGFANWEDSVGEERLRESGNTKTATTRKKKKRKHPSTSFSEAADDISKRKKQNVGKKSEVQRQPKTRKQTDTVDDIHPSPAIEVTHRKKADLKAKKKLLLAVAAAAAGDVDGPSADFDLDEHTPDHDPERGSESGGELALMSNNLRPWERPESILGMNKTEKLKAKSRPVDQAATKNNQRSRISGARQRLTPDTSSQARGPQTGLFSKPHQVQDIQAVRQKRGSSSGQKQSASKGKRVSEKETENLIHVDSSDEVDPDISRIHSRNGILSDMNETAAFIEDPQLESNVSTPNSSPRSISRFRGNTRATLEGQTLQPKARRNPQARDASIRNEPQEDILLIDPALRMLDADFEPAPQQIGVYRPPDTPPTVHKRKRRLPVDDDYEELMALEESHKKKPRKSLIRPKTPKPSAPNKRNVFVRNPSADLDAALSTAKKTQSPGKKRGPRKSEANRALAVGRFSDDEFALLELEMRKHREMHGLTEFEQKEMIQDTRRNEIIIELWDMICSVLPDRSRSNITKILRRRYHNYVRGTWSKEEENELKEAYERQPNRWVDISKLINRHPDDCRDRWRNYVVCGDKQKKEPWSEEEEIQLRIAVAECVQAVRELKAAEVANNPGIIRNDQRDIELIDWQVVSAKLDHTRSRLQCLSKYKLLEKMADEDDDDVPDLEIHDQSWRVAQSKKDIQNMRREDYLELLWAIRNSGAGREGKVPWQKLGDMDFRTKWPCMTRKVAWRKLREKVPGNREMKFQDIVTLLIDNLPLEDGFNSEERSNGPHKESSGGGKALTAPDVPKRQKNHRSGATWSVANRKEDPFMSDLGEDEFDPDDIRGDLLGLSTDNRNLDSTQNMVREAVEAYEDEDEDSWNGRGDSGDDVEEMDNDVLMDYSHAESIDLDAPSQEDLAAGKAARLRSPIAFKVTGQKTTSSYSGSSTHSDEEDADMDIPARRSARQESVDLGMT